MPADPSIYNMIRPPAAQPGPLDNFGTMLQLKNMVDQGQLNDLHRQKLSGDLQEEEAFKSKIADWVKAGGQGNLPVDAYAASPSRAGAFDKSRLDAAKSNAELAEKKMATLAKGASLIKDRMATVKDEPSYQGFLQYAVQVMGPDDVKKMNLPPAYDPEFIKRSLAKADEMFTPKPQTVNLGGKEVVIDMNPFTNPKVVGMELPKTQTPGEMAPVWDEARGVFVQRPAQGAPAAAPAAPAAPGAPAGPAAAPAAAAAPGVIRPTGLPPKPTDVHNLRNEFNALPEVKQYKDTLPIVEAARTSPDTRAGDIQLAYAVGKILDPNSVVREGELKMSADAQTTLAKYYGEMQSAVTGKGRLSPETRGELVKMLDNAVDQRELAYNQAVTTYKGIAEKNGVPVDQVIITPMKRTAAPELPRQPTRNEIDAELRRRKVIK